MQLSFLEPVVAILLIYRSLPFSGLILFFGLQWYASKPEVSRKFPLLAVSSSPLLVHLSKSSFRKWCLFSANWALCILLLNRCVVPAMFNTKTAVEGRNHHSIPSVEGCDSSSVVTLLVRSKLSRAGCWGSQPDMTSHSRNACGGRVLLFCS